MQKKLSELDFGESGIINEICASEHELNRLGIRLNKRLRMITRQPIKGPIVVVIDDIEVALGLGIAENVIIRFDRKKQGDV